MTKNKNCEGCGRELQNLEIDKPGYAPNVEATFCMECFKSLNYGEKQNNLTEFNIEEYLEIIKKNDSEVILVIDILNPYQTIIKDLNKYVDSDRLTLVVNKVDVLPKAISAETIIEYIANIAEIRNVQFKNISLVSSTKYENIDSIYEYIQSLDSRVSVIGYSNVGKSSFIKALFASKLVKVNNLISYTIGTTLEPIELNLDGQIIVDYPGFFLNGNIQNILDKKELRKAIPRKEIKVKTYQLDEGQWINIGKLADLIIDKQYSNQGYQFSFSNDFDIERRKSEKFQTKKNYEMKEIKLLHGVQRQDIIICGLGTITLENFNQKVSVYVPKNVSVNVVESLYN